MSHVERYHGPLRIAYMKIKSSLPRSRPLEILQLAVKAVNDMTGPEGLCSTLLAFGAIPKPVRPGFSPNQVERARAIDSAMKEVAKVHAKSRIRATACGSIGWRKKWPRRAIPGSTRTRLSQKGQEVGGTVRVHWQCWGNRMCSTTPWTPNISIYCCKPATADIGVASVYKVQNTSDKSYNLDFTEARQKELDGLNSLGVFEVVKRTEVLPDMRIYKLGRVEKAKVLDDGSTVLKWRIVARNYRDAAATSIPTRSPAVTR